MNNQDIELAIEDIRERRDKMQQRIAGMINTEFHKFINETGVYPTSISLTSLDISTIQNPKRQLFYGVEITLEI